MCYLEEEEEFWLGDWDGEECKRDGIGDEVGEEK